MRAGNAELAIHHRLELGLLGRIERSINRRKSLGVDRRLLLMQRFYLRRGALDPAFVTAFDSRTELRAQSRFLLSHARLLNFGGGQSRM